jgi:hypothetical protein
MSNPPPRVVHFKGVADHYSLCGRLKTDKSTSDPESVNCKKCKKWLKLVKKEVLTTLSNSLQFKHEENL